MNGRPEISNATFSLDDRCVVESAVIYLDWVQAGAGEGARAGSLNRRHHAGASAYGSDAGTAIGCRQKVPSQGW